MRYLWCFVTLLGILCVSYAVGTDGSQPVAAGLGGFLTVLGLGLATTPGTSR